MRIIIVQSDIEEAIRAYLLTQINVKEGMRMDIDLSATRGEDGFKATIDIVPEDAPVTEPETQLGIASKIAAAQAETQVTRRPRRTKEQMEADKAAELATTGAQDGPVVDTEAKVLASAPVEAEALPEAADEPTLGAEAMPEAEPKAETEVHADAAVAVEAAEEAPAPRPSLFGGLKHPKAPE